MMRNWRSSGCCRLSLDLAAPTTSAVTAAALGRSMYASAWRSDGVASGTVSTTRMMVVHSSAALLCNRRGFFSTTKAVLQGLPIVLQSEEPESTLLAKAGYALFVVAHVTDETFGLYGATMNKLMVVGAGSDGVLAAVAFLDEQVDADRFSASILFPEDATPALGRFLATLKEQSKARRVVIGPDAWSIVYASFRAQQEHVRGLALPLGFEHASYLMTNKRFAPLNVPEAFQQDASSPSQVVPAAPSVTIERLTEHNNEMRRALVVWDALLNVHKRFGAVGSKKLLNPIDLVVRRAVKAVNIFGVDMDNRLGKGSVVEGITMVVTIYNVQAGTNTVHQIRNLTEETIKLNALTTLLYGEGTSSMTVLYPSPRTKEQQLAMFARLCKPKCPFFIVQPNALAPIFDVPASAFNFTNVTDPKLMFQQMIGACVPGAAKKDEEANGNRVVQALTHVGQKLFDARIGNTVKSFTSGLVKIPNPRNAVDDFAEMQAVQAPATTSVFLNNVSRIPDAAELLQQWRARIYDNPDRLARETETLKGMERYLIVDLETTTNKRYKRIANPFTKENHIVLSGALDYKGNVYIPDAYFPREVALAYDDAKVCATYNDKQLLRGVSPQSLFLPPLDEFDVLVGHNFKFDMLHLWRDAELKRFLKRGGKIWDTMYAEYLLTGHQVKLGRGAGLEDVAKSYGGQTPKLDLVKQAWAEGKETFDIPHATLKEYLIGDLKNTALIFNKHRKRALEQRQAIICCARMDSLLATTEMEYNGLKIDVPLAIKQSNELVGESVRMKQKLDACIPSEVPKKLRKFYNWASNHMLIPYFFGGRVKINTGNRESKQTTGERVPRHLIYADASQYPQEEYPDGVFLASPTNAGASGDCVVVTTNGDAEKGTRLFVTCVDGYMKQAGLRKSSTLADSVSKKMVAVSRDSCTITDGATPDAVGNLIPERVVFLYCAAETDPASGALASLVFMEAASGTARRIPATSELATAVEAYFREMVVQHTKALLPPEGSADLSILPDAFLDAQVVVVARDAPFTFRKLLESHSPEMRDMLLRRFEPMPASADVVSVATAPALDLKNRFCVTFADATSTMLYYYATYGDATMQRCAATTDKNGGATSADNLIILPEFMPTISGKAKKRPSLIPLLLDEAKEDATQWCGRYRKMFAHIAKQTLLSEGAEPLMPKKVRKNAPPPKDDDALPLLLRRRPCMVEAYRKMAPERQDRLGLMMLFGRIVGTSFDAMVEPSPFDATVEIPLKGKLAQYLGTESSPAMDNVTKKFRSPVTRQLQVGDDSLSYFAKTHKDEVADLIMDLRGKEKLIGTYYEHTEGGTGMVSLTHSIDSCIHHELVHNKTNTGRLASANPNCQNIPKEDKSPLREMFVSRFAPHGKCIEVDYSQLEVITLAALSNDRQMIADLVNNIDFHCKRVTMIRPDLSYADVVQRAKKDKEPAYVKLRQQAKIFSFQRQYGAGVVMLSESTGLSQDQIRQLIEAEREIYSGCDAFTNVVTLSANGYDASLQDGNRNIRGHQFYKGMFPVLTGSRYVFTESDVPEAILRDKPASTKSTNFSPTHIKNYPVQGFAGEIVQIMLGKLWRHFVANENYGGKALLTNTVHDCVWVDTTDDIYIQVSKDVERILSSAKEELNRLWPEMECPVRFGVDVVAGDNMCHLRPIPKQ